jgi:predicted Zn-dependent peptidase
MSGKAAALACLLLASVLAQDSRPATRPESRRAVEEIADWGLRVRVVPIDVPGEIAVILGFRNAGILSEPAGQPHLAHLSEHARFWAVPEATEWGKALKRWYAEGRATAETLPEMMYFDLYPKRDELRTALMIQLQRLFPVAADEAVLEREKPIALSEVTGLEKSRTAAMDGLGKFAWSAFTQAAFHGASEVPFKAHTALITRDEVQSFWGAERFRPDRAMLTIAGNVDVDTVDAELDAIFKKITASIMTEPWTPSPPKLGPVKTSWDVGSHQAFVAWPGPPPSHPDHPALAVFARVLATRVVLSHDLRAAARQPVLVHGDVGGMFVVQAPLQAADGGETFAIGVKKAVDFSTTAQGLLLLKTAKSTVRVNSGFAPAAIEYPPSLPRRIMVHANYELARMRVTLTAGQTAEEYCARVDAVTAEQVQTAAKTWLAPERATVVTIAGKE